MASPPRQHSPPYPPHIPLPNPRKRPTLSSLTNPPKRRKAASSITGSATSAHPLRQTSFPPEESQKLGQRSPSVDSDVTGVTGGKSDFKGGIVGKKRGKGKKGKREASGSVKTGLGDVRRGTSEVLEEEAEEDEDLGIGDGEEGDVVDRDAERKNLAILVDAFNSGQAERYEMYRRVKLKKETVRKITNQTLSQSVPASVITTINGYTKIFIGLLVERARDIQTQHHRLTLTPPPTPSSKTIPVDPTDFHAENPNNDIFSTTASEGAAVVESWDGEGKEEVGDIGPLLPDSLREGFRRYKRDGEGGGTGLSGVSLGMGIVGSAVARVGGRRFLR